VDNVTHTLTGLMLARACGVSEAGVPRGALLMMLAANLPDIDAVSGLWGAAVYLDQHRWITHGMVVAPLMAFVAVLLMRLFSREKKYPWPRAWAFALLAVSSHLMLDWTNVYGIRLMAPFAQQWLRLDTVHIVDPWLLAGLLLAVCAPWLSKLVGSEIGGGQMRSPQKGWAFFALAFVLVYEGGRFIAHARAIAELSARTYGQGVPERVTALPHAMNPFRWTGVVEQTSSVVLVPVNLLAEFDPGAGKTFYRPGAEWDWAMKLAEKDPSFQALRRFAQLPFWKVTLLTEPENSVRVTLLDLRFGTPTEPGFAASGVATRGGGLDQVKISLGSVTKAFR